MKAVLIVLATAISMTSILAVTAHADDNQSLGSCSNFFPSVQAQLSLTGKEGEIFVDATKLPVVGSGKFYFHHTSGNTFVAGNSSIRLTHLSGSKYSASLTTKFGSIDLECSLNEATVESKVLVASVNVPTDRSTMVAVEPRDSKYVGIDRTDDVKILPTGVLDIY